MFPWAVGVPDRWRATPRAAAAACARVAVWARAGARAVQAPGRAGFGWLRGPRAGLWALRAAGPSPAGWSVGAWVAAEWLAGGLPIGRRSLGQLAHPAR